jgi:hypothetical protein
MKISVVWREDRWGEEGEVVAAFSDHAAAVRWAKAETKRTHTKAEDRHELWFARVYSVIDLELDDPSSKTEREGIDAPAVSDRVETSEGVDLTKLRAAIPGRRSTGPSEIGRR